MIDVQYTHIQKYKTGVTPELTFELDSDNFIVLNNERGFREKDVRAICDISKSTKGKGGAGYIGQKGIGFKSVFRVSDYPEIHSNGYHFSLDNELKILPHSIDMKNIRSHHMKDTCIVLPLNDEMKMKTQHLSTKLDDINPLLLLFLNQLKKLTIIDKSKSNISISDMADSEGRSVAVTTVMERVDNIDEGVVELRTIGVDKNSIEKFVVIKKRLTVSKAIARNEKVLTTDLAIAFTLPSTDSSGDESQNRVGGSNSGDLSNFPVFSYLPVQPYGFRFILQGDFVLSSARESITTDNPWNKYLRSQIPSIFLEAVEKAKKGDSLLTIQLVLDALPSESEVSDFFKSSVLDIIYIFKLLFICVCLYDFQRPMIILSMCNIYFSLSHTRLKK